MRRIDKKKSMMGKAAKTINFDKIVLAKLEERSVKENTKVSSIVNMLCRRYILGDVNFFSEMAKLHYLKFMEFKYMKDQAELRIQTNDVNVLPV